MKTLALLIGFLPNPRIYKRISLEKQIYNLHLICWDRGSEMQKKPQEDGFIVHCISQQASSDPLKRIIPYRKFFRKAMEELEKISPDVIHVQGVDMLDIACMYKGRVKREIKIIYEVADLHRLLVDEQKSLVKKLAQAYLRRLDYKCCQDIDLLIVTSEMYVTKYFHALVPSQKTMIFPNVPDLSAFENYQKKSKSLPFTVGFIGDMRYPEQMKNLVTAVKKCNMNLLIAGFEQGGSEIEPLCRSYDKAEWYGRFDFKSEAAQLYGKCDVIYSVYDADMANVRVAIPNKLYESIYCCLPIIVAKNTYLETIVKDWGVGVSVDHHSVQDLVDVLTELKDNSELYNKIVSKCELHKQDVDLAPYNENLKQILIKF